MKRSLEDAVDAAAAQLTAAAAAMADAYIELVSAQWKIMKLERDMTREVSISTKDGTRLSTLISTEDYDDMPECNWYLDKMGYAYNTQTPHRSVQRFIMRDQLYADPDKPIVDHINGNRLDNRRSNLRMVSYTQNALNSRKRKNATSIYRGVSRAKDGMFHAQATVLGKLHYVGKYATEMEAVEAYDAFLYQHPLAASLENQRNFPDKDYSNYVHYKKRRYGARKDTTPKIRTHMTQIDATSVQLHMKGNYNTAIDAEDYERVKYVNCYAARTYVRCGNTQLLHRLLMNVTDPNITVDHIDHDHFNNRKSNLRLVPRAINSQNQPKRKGVRGSTLHGVYRSGKQFFSAVSAGHEQVFRSIACSEEHAGRRRDLYLIAHPEYIHARNYQWTMEDINHWTQLIDDIDRTAAANRKPRFSQYKGVVKSGNGCRTSIRLTDGTKVAFNNKSDLVVALDRDEFILANPERIRTKTKRDPLIIALKDEEM